MIFKNTDQIEIGFDNDTSSTYMYFKKQVNEDDFIEAHHELQEVLNTRNYTTGKHLVDTSNLKVITPYASKWVAENIVSQIQKVSANGKARIAVILGSNAFTDFGAEHIHSKYGDSVHIHFFSRRDDANLWLSPILETVY